MSARFARRRDFSHLANAIGGSVREQQPARPTAHIQQMWAEAFHQVLVGQPAGGRASVLRLRRSEQLWDRAFAGRTGGGQ